jgi:hypothetical protein
MLTERKAEVNMMRCERVKEDEGGCMNKAVCEGRGLEVRDGRLLTARGSR